MRRTCLGLLLAALLLAPGLAAETPDASPKVVLVSLDGAANWLVEEMLARGVLPADGALARLVRRGVRAEAMIPVAPSLTAPSHTAMFTGAYPERNGIVSNSLLLPGDPISKTTSGFSAPIEAETLWQAARRQGRRVVCATAVGADARSPERTCDLTFAYGAEQGRGTLVLLTVPHELTGEPGSARHLQASRDSPAPLAFRLFSGEIVELEAQAAATAAGDRLSFDTLLLRVARQAGGEALRLVPGVWAPLWLPLDSRSVGRRLGAWVKLIALAEDGSAARLYLGPPGENSGDPGDFLTALEVRQGPWPGEPDYRSLDRGLIEESLWLEQAERLARYLTEATADTMQDAEWDLFLTYLPLIDEVEHRFLLRSLRHPDYDAEAGARRARYAGYVDWAYRLADELLLRLMEAAPPGTNFVVVSDHGMIPVHTQVLVHAALERAGFQVTPDDSTEVRAVTSGTTAHIYVNLAGRRPGGVVPAEKYEESVERIMAALGALRDPVSGEAVFEIVARRAELGGLRLDAGERAGDLWVTARPGFHTSARLEPGAAPLQPTETFATHGNPGHHAQMHAIFFAAGPQVTPRPLGIVKAVDVAPIVSALLGIGPPADAVGRDVLTPVH